MQAKHRAAVGTCFETAVAKHLKVAHSNSETCGFVALRDPSILRDGQPTPVGRKAGTIRVPVNGQWNCDSAMARPVHFQLAVVLPKLPQCVLNPIVFHPQRENSHLCRWMTKSQLASQRRSLWSNLRPAAVKWSDERVARPLPS